MENVSKICRSIFFFLFSEQKRAVIKSELYIIEEVIFERTERMTTLTLQELLIAKEDVAQLQQYFAQQYILIDATSTHYVLVERPVSLYKRYRFVALHDHTKQQQLLIQQWVGVAITANDNEHVLVFRQALA